MLPTNKSSPLTSVLRSLAIWFAHHTMLLEHSPGSAAAFPARLLVATQRCVRSPRRGDPARTHVERRRDAISAAGLRSHPVLPTPQAEFNGYSADLSGSFCAISDRLQ